MSLCAPVKLKVPERHVWHVDLSDIYLKRNSVSKYFLLFFISFLIFFSSSRWNCLGCKSLFVGVDKIEHQTWYRLLVTSFNRTPQLCVKGCVWYSPAVDVFSPHIPFTGSQEWMSENFTCCSDNTGLHRPGKQLTSQCSTKVVSWMGNQSTQKKWFTQENLENAE